MITVEYNCFKQTVGTKKSYGCIVTPMEYIPYEIWDILDTNGNITEHKETQWQRQLVN